MKVPCDEGVAIHIGPKSCAVEHCESLPADYAGRIRSGRPRSRCALATLLFGDAPTGNLNQTPPAAFVPADRRAAGHGE